jgi:hypothetical protein
MRPTLFREVLAAAFAMRADFSLRRDLALQLQVLLRVRPAADGLE